VTDILTVPIASGEPSLARPPTTAHDVSEIDREVRKVLMVMMPPTRVVAAVPTFAHVPAADGNAVVEATAALAGDGDAVVEPAATLAGDGDAVVEPAAALAGDGDAVVEPAATLEATTAAMQATATAIEAAAGPLGALLRFVSARSRR